MEPPLAKSAAVKIGKAISTRMLVKKMFQVKIGSRHIVIPGARRQMMVVIMLTAPRMVDSPPTISPIVHRLPPTLGENCDLDNGV
jgi:hypothetical protein